MTLWVVAASFIPASAAASPTPSRSGGARPSATGDLASRVFAPSADRTSSPAPVTPRPTFLVTREAAERGASLFVIKGCVLCHGEQAEGQFGPRIAHTVLPLEDVRRQARTPRNIYMPMFTPPLLSEDELVDIYTFLQSLPPE